MSNPSSSTDGPPKGIRALRSRLGWWWQAPAGLLVLSIAIVLITTIAFGATRPNVGNPPGPAVSATPQRSGLFTPAGSPPALAPAPVQAELDAEVARIEEKYGVLIGITISQAASPSRTSQETWRGGTLQGGPAFGTIDVAMALAVLADSKQPSDRDYLFNRALADNSRAAQDAMWAFLGSPEDASRKTTQALRRYGDWRTVVPATSTRNPQSPYLDTEWSLEAQSRLAGAMRCDYVDVHPAMSKLNDPAHNAWGLQTLPLTYSKGEWGTLANGDIMVRQFGTMRLSDGTQVGIAMAATGGFDEPADGEGAITELANTVRRVATGFAEPSC